MSIGLKIKNLRKKRGLTQKQLGERCGIADSNIRKYENGQQNPKIETLRKIADALNVTIIENCGQIDLIMTTGGQIAFERQKKGISQEELAEQLGITPAILSQYEHDKKKLDSLMGSMIAAKLGCSLEELGVSVCTNELIAIFESIENGKISEALDSLTDEQTSEIKHMCEYLNKNIDKTIIPIKYKSSAEKCLTLLNNREPIVCEHTDTSLNQYLKSKNDIDNGLELLNDKGLKKVLDQIILLLKIPEYRKDTTSKQDNLEPIKCLAAHTRTDVEQTPEGIQHDLDIMNDDSEWK